MKKELEKHNIILELRRAISAMVTEISMYSMVLSLHNLSLKILSETDDVDKNLKELIQFIGETKNSLDVAVKDGESLEKYLDDLNDKLFEEQKERLQ